MAAEGVAEIQALQQGGFSPEEINAWKEQTANELRGGGFSDQEIDEYFGVKNPDMSKVETFFKGNIADLQKLPPSPPSAQGLPGPAPQTPQVETESAEPKKATNFLEALDAGFQMSVSGLFVNKRLPDTVLPEHADLFMRIASQVGTLAGDIPAIAAGTVAGGGFGAGFGAGVSGPAAPAGAVIGGAIGAGAGGFAMPSAMRQALIEQYEKGDIKDFEDFWARTSAIAIEGLKGAAVGAATVGTGQVTGKLLGAAAAPVVKTTAQLTSEVAAMTVVGKALEGEVPNYQDFIDSAIMVGGFHAVSHLTNKALNVYKATGIKPTQVLEHVQTDPVIRGEFMERGKDVPVSYRPFQDAPPKLIEVEVGAKERPDRFVMTPMENKTANEKVGEKIVAHPEKTKESYSVERLYEDTVDYLGPLKDFENALLGKEKAKTLNIEKSVYGLARTHAGSEGQVRAWLKFGPENFLTGEKTGTRGVMTVLEEMGAEKRQLGRQYAVSKRALELAERGIETGVDLKAAKEVVRTTPKEIVQYTAEIRKFQEDVTQYAIDSGLVSAENAARFRELNQDYTPFYRLHEESTRGTGTGSGRSASNPIKGIKGSEREILDPYESIVKNAAVVIRQAEKNKMLRNIAELAQKDPELAKEIGIERVPVEIKPIEVKPGELPDGIPAEAFTIFRKKDFNLRENEISFFRDGKREVWTVPPDMKRALDGMTASEANTLLKLMNGFSKSLKLGVTTSIDFVIRNPIRDQLSAFTVSKNGYLPAWDAVRGLGAILKEDARYQEWLYRGGANSALSDFDARLLSYDFKELNRQTGFKDAVINQIKKPVHALHLVAELSENATRVGEFIRAKEKGKSGKQAAFESRDLIDFAKVGAKGRAVNQMIAFWNVNVQGKVRLAQAIKEDPKGVTARIVAGTVMPTVLLWWAQKDDPRIDGVPNWQKDNFFVVATDRWEDVDPMNPPPEGSYTRVVDGKLQVNNGVIYRLPMSQDTALVSALVRRTLDAYVKDNPRAYNDLGKAIARFGEVPYMPNAFAPVLEQVTNHSFFTDRPLIPGSLEKVHGDMQFTEYTTESAKQLGKLVRTAFPVAQSLNLDSPIIIENYVRQWAGTNGMYILQLADKALISSGAVKDPKKPTPTWSDTPFAKAFFVRYPSMSDQDIADFNKRFEAASKEINTIKRKAKMGMVDDAIEQYEAAAAEGKLNQLSGVKSGIENMQQLVSKISISDAYSPDDKRQLIDQAILAAISTAREANKALDEIERDLKRK